MTLTRRSALALLAVTGLSGCTFKPIQWDPSAAPIVSAPGDGAVEVRADYFAQSPDSGDRTLQEGIPVSLRISTPHFDARFDRRFTGQSLGAVTAAQVREQAPIKAPDGYELVAFTLEAGAPIFGATEDAAARVSIEIGDGVTFPLAAPFGRYNASTGSYDRNWALVVFSVPSEVPVTLAVVDADKRVSVDIRSGEPVVDEGWRANRGFRERIQIGVEGGQSVLERELVAVVNGQQVHSRFRLGLDPVAAYGLVPWNPEDGWAEGDRQWLRIAMNAKAEFVPDSPTMIVDLDVTRSFSYQEAPAEPLAAQLPRTITTEAIQRGSSELDVTWAVPGAGDSASLTCNPVGTALVRFSDHPDVAAEFTGSAQPVTYELRFSPRRG
ncbi:hypothetical protein SAMN02745244_00095 [Tessaracoccus bendigoensis DSM 12906]|uniref:Uncharacterized protein n=1 Tax=Tessaracoccus bendigoensis DSM 12906 TaxID=1123357 RepID=A0A1M6A476_9ACTN|nr:hypothetical protein [Tessaracoccus bendigoensis]SHI31324.1 hypothetical protein SAMN02745244_00095 [Tessaracoccus bendigoensis DSM 12906]